METIAFKPLEISGIRFKNRIIRSATHEGMADETGIPDERLKKLYVSLAKGSAGAIITGFTGIRQDGKSSMHNMIMIDRDEVIPAFKEITDAVHEYNTPIIMQVAHCGRQTRSKSTGEPVKGVSPIRHKFFNEDLPHELTQSEINEIINGFVLAAIRAKNAGFDAIQLHAAHGFLLSEFLSSHSNRRNDQWGGSIKNRFRIVKEILERTKEKTDGFPVFIKLNSHDSQKNGMIVDEAVAYAKMLEQAGCDGIEVSCGTIEDGLYTIRGEKLPAEAALQYTFKYESLPLLVKKVAGPFLKAVVKQPKPLNNYNLDAAVKIRKAVNIPVMVVGGINSFDSIDKIINRHGIDLVSMSRPFIIQPDIVEKFKSGDLQKSKCIMCNFCAILIEKRSLKCYYGKLPK